MKRKTNEKTILLDSSVWIELFGAGERHDACKDIFQRAQTIIVPSLVQFEVYKKILKLKSESHALSAISTLRSFSCVDLTPEVALTAADLSVEFNLPMADSIVLAHAQLADAVLFTLDNYFSKIDGVQVIR